jgi:hypothetical protein
MAGAIAQGAPTVTLDYDLWVDVPQRSYMRLTNLALEVGFEQIRPTVFIYKDICTVNFCYQIHGLQSFAKEYRNAVHLRVLGATLPVLPLDRIIKSKRFVGRDKDKAMLPFLEYTLQSQKILKRKKML